MSEQEEIIYRNTQIGYVTGGAGVFGMLVVYFSGVSAGGAGLFGYGMLVAMGIVTVLFSSLTVEVTEQTFRFYFGPGFGTRRFDLGDIQNVDVVRNQMYYGWGIRWTFHGWLYNVSGLQAVELDIRGEGTIRVGTNEPERLKEALGAA